MNLDTFRQPTTFPPGSVAAVLPAPAAYPLRVTIAGQFTADKDCYSAEGTYGGTYYPTGTNAGTHPACFVFWATNPNWPLAAPSPTVYAGTYFSSAYGINLPYGWTGTIVTNEQHTTWQDVDQNVIYTLGDLDRAVIRASADGTVAAFDLTSYPS